MDPSQSSDAEEDHRRKRKYDSDGFLRPSTPEQPPMSYYRDTPQTDNKEDSETAGSGYDDETQNDGITSQYFQHTDTPGVDHTQMGAADQMDEQTNQDVGEDLTHREAESVGVANQPDATGAAPATATTKSAMDRAIEETLRRGEEERKEMWEYYNGLFRLSVDYEVKVVEKLEMLMGKAEELDATMLQHRETVMNRVHGISQILHSQ